MLIPQNSIIEKLINFNENLSHLKLNCWINSQKDFNIYIFSSFINDEKHLLTYYNELNDVIAVHFQSELSKDIEKWNLYLVFFVSEKVSKSTKYKIEQDKYSTRKLIFDEIHDESSIPQLLDKKLFSLNCDFEDDTSHFDVSIEDMLARQHIELLNLLKIEKITSKDRLEKYLEVKK